MGYVKNKIREVVKALLEEKEKDISFSLQRNAVYKTAKYVEKNMNKTKSFQDKKEVMYYAIEEALKENGIILEFGVFQGESINFIASVVSKNKRIYGFDSFEGLPSNWRTNFEKGTFKIQSLPDVSENVELVKGLFNETLPEFIENHKHDKILLIHIDCDLYESTKVVFDILSKKISKGMIIVFDEYFNYPGWEEGEHKAFMEFINANHIEYEYIAYNSLHEQVVVRIL